MYRPFVEGLFLRGIMVNIPQELPPSGSGNINQALMDGFYRMAFGVAQANYRIDFKNLSTYSA